MYHNNEPSRSPRRGGFDELFAASAFLQVVRSHGFSHAAAALGKSTSSVSRAVSELEAHLGAQLLTRTTRCLHLTEAGALYLRHAEALLAAQRAGHDAVAELTGGVPRGHLRVSMPVAVGERLFGPHLPELRSRHPELRFDVDLSDQLVPLVEGGYDLAIRVGRLADSSLRAQLLGRVPVRLVASPTYLESASAPKRPLELREHDYITLGPEGGPAEWVFHHRRDHRVERVEVEGIVHTSSAPLAAQLAESGLGVLRIIEWVVRDALREGSLVEVLPSWSCDRAPEGGVPVYVLYAQTAANTPPLKSRVFVEFVKQIMAKDVLAPGVRRDRQGTSRRIRGG